MHSTVHNTADHLPPKSAITAVEFSFPSHASAGEPNATFCLVSDNHVHINGYYGGRFGKYGDDENKALTWIRKLGLLWGHHTIELAVREGPRWQYDAGYMGYMRVDGMEVKLSQAGDSVAFARGRIVLTWLAARHRSGNDLVDVYEVRIRKVLKLKLVLRPEVEQLRTLQDGVVHFAVEIPHVALTDSAHGVLGQTYRSDFQSRL